MRSFRLYLGERKHLTAAGWLALVLAVAVSSAVGFLWAGWLANRIGPGEAMRWLGAGAGLAAWGGYYPVCRATGFQRPRRTTGSAGGTARLWDAPTGKLLHTFRAGGPVARVAPRIIPRSNPPPADSVRRITPPPAPALATVGRCGGWPSTAPTGSAPGPALPYCSTARWPAAAPRSPAPRRCTAGCTRRTRPAPHAAASVHGG